MTVLDTDVLSLLMQGHEGLVRRLEPVRDACTTIVTRIEILQGRFASILKAEDGSKLMQAQHWLRENERFLTRVPVLPFDRDAADAFDRLRADRRLRRIGRTDLLVAAIVLSRQALLLTRNLRDFRQVQGLRVEDWAD